MIFEGTQIIKRPSAARCSDPVEAAIRPILRHAKDRRLDTGC